MLGAQSSSCATIRPNLGRRTVDKVKLRERLQGGSLRACSVGEAMPIWKREFELGDISEHETYQFSCRGRHKEVSMI